MRHINKGEEPASLAAWKAEEIEDWKPTWQDLRAQEKRDLHHALLEEQGYICCYCEMPIARETSHIEHLKPRSKYLELALEYGNLLASCQRERRGVEHCGYNKDDWYDEALLVSPLQENCAEFFKYDEDGHILATEVPDRQAAASTTIEKLGLGASNLVRMRKNAIEVVLDDTEELTHEEIEQLIEGFQLPDASGHYQEFGSAIAYILREYFLT